MSNPAVTDRTILCLSRAYLARLLPALEKRDAGATYLHMVQTDREAAQIAAQGGEVVLNMQQVVREALLGKTGPLFREPDDFREVTGYLWSPVHADRYLPTFTPEVRLRIAGALFEALERIFAERRIDAFISEPVALFVTHATFYLARKHGARRLLWANGFFPDYFYFTDGIDISRPARAKPMDDAEFREMAEGVRAYVEGVVEDRRGPVYHPNFLAKKLTPLSYFRQRKGEEPLVMGPGWRSRLIQRLRLLRVRAARAFFPRFSDFMSAGAVEEHGFYLRALGTGPAIYDALPSEYDPDNVVYPLQYEPEASLIYFAPDFRDQPVFVEAVLRALPQGKVLWVKEHPNQFGALGEKRWREMKRRYDNLRFVHGRQSGRQLIRNCGLAVMISSSAGVDAIVTGRRCIVAGKVYSRGYPGTIPVSSYAEIAAALNDPANYGPVDHRAEILERLIDFGRHCYRGDPQPSHGLYQEENLQRLVAAIRAECGV